MATALSIVQLLPHAEAADLRLSFPVSCTLYENCWVSSYFDLERNSAKAEDYTCGAISKNRQNGTQISLKSIQSIKNNVPVIAAEEGKVTNIYDGLADLVIPTDKLSQYNSNPCGNAVMIEHKGGWFTRYCHLAQNSIAVRPGQTVRKGQVIGNVGTSGATDWPRLDFSVSRNNYLFDPFSGKTTLEKCGGSISPLWEEDMDYTPFAVMQSGFYVGVPNQKRAELGQLPHYPVLPLYTPEISFWALLMNVRDGDRLVMEITDPNGRTFKEIDEELPFNADRYMVYLRAEKKNIEWDEGLYTGTIRLLRYDGAEEYEAFRTNTVKLYRAKR